MSRLEGLKARMEVSPDCRVSLTDPDARSMASQGKGTGIVGYNVQTAVDTQHHLIVALEVTNVGSDWHQLKRMSEQAREALGYDKSDFVYEPERDAFRCPAGEYAIRRFTSVEKGMAIHKYWSSACPRCEVHDIRLPTHRQMGARGRTRQRARVRTSRKRTLNAAVTALTAEAGTSA